MDNSNEILNFFSAEEETEKTDSELLGKYQFKCKKKRLMLYF